jgi:hypothetical protein
LPNGEEVRQIQKWWYKYVIILEKFRRVALFGI